MTRRNNLQMTKKMNKNILKNRIKLLAVQILLLATATACGPTTYVYKDGKKIPLEQAVEIDASIAMEAEASGQKNTALKLWSKFIEEYPFNKYSPKALFEVGKKEFKQGRCKEAESFLSQIITKAPGSKFAPYSKILIAACMAKRNDNKGSLDLLKSIDPRKLKEDWRKFYYSIQIKNAEKVGDPLITTICAAGLERLEKDESKREILKEKVKTLILTKLSDKQLKKVEDFFEGSPPADMALFKRAKMAYLNRDLAKAYRLLKKFLRNYPESVDAVKAAVLMDEIKEQKIIDKNKIGVLLPLSGEKARLGEKILEGIWFASKTFDNKPYGLTFSIRDTEGNPARTTQAFEELILKEHVIAVIGTIFADTAEAAAKQADKFGVPLITFSQAEGPSDISTYVFQNSITKERQAEVIIKTAVEKLGIKKFGIIYPNNSYGKTFAKAFYKKALKYPQVTFTAISKYPPKESNFEIAVKKLIGLWKAEILRKNELCPDKNKKCNTKKAKPVIDFEALFIPDGIKPLNQIAPTLFYYDVTGIQLLGPNLWNTKNIFFAKNENYFQGAIFSDINLNLSNIKKSFLLKFGKNMDVLHAMAYDATSLLIKALKDKNASSREELKNILSDPNFVIDGATGKFSFDKNGKAVISLCAYIVDDKKILPLKSGYVVENMEENTK